MSRRPEQGIGRRSRPAALRAGGRPAQARIRESNFALPAVAYAPLVDTVWRPASDPPPLAPGEVHVWRIEVDDEALDDGPLDADERDRRDRLRDPRLARRYAAAHVARRRLLARYLDVAAEAVVFDHAPCPACGEPHGKPRLAGDAALSFSLARRGELALLAVAAGVEVGVDVEDEARGTVTVAQARSAIVASAEEPALSSLPERAAARELVRL